jgi:hypothetical protein
MIQINAFIYTGIHRRGGVVCAAFAAPAAAAQQDGAVGDFLKKQLLQLLARVFFLLPFSSFFLVFPQTKTSDVILATKRPQTNHTNTLKF